MNISKANIEDLKYSIIDSDVKFTTSIIKARVITQLRINNFSATQMCWITLKPVIDCGNTLYNPRALIFNILN